MQKAPKFLQSPAAIGLFLLLKLPQSHTPETKKKKNQHQLVTQIYCV